MALDGRPQGANASALSILVVSPAVLASFAQLLLASCLHVLFINVQLQK